LNALSLALDRTDQLSNPIVRASIRGLLRGYDARWREEQRTISDLQVEQQLDAGIYNLAAKRISASRSFTSAGKIDKVGKQFGERLIWDHKTTSLDIESESAYWRQLSVESQPSHYEILAHLNGVKVSGVVWDVVRKPTIRPKKIAKKDLAELRETGIYSGQSAIGLDVPEDGEKETPELFELRVFAATEEDPDKFFARRSVKRTRDELAEYARELWQLSKEILAARRTDSHYRNSGACMLYGSACGFLGICSGYDRPDSTNWTEKDQVHNELDLEGDGREVLTNSRLRCFQTCRRKHFYSYELGIKRADEEEREALAFGSAWHDVMDVYWGCFSNGDDER